MFFSFLIEAFHTFFSRFDAELTDIYGKHALYVRVLFLFDHSTHLGLLFLCERPLHDYYTV